MTNWTGIGMNYGHSVTGASYSTAQVESDLSYLISRGLTRIRIAFPSYGDVSGLITDCQDMAVRALNHDLYVAWGMSTGASNGSLSATVWTNYKAYVTGILALWAQAHNLTELSLGNECELQADGVTLTQTTVRADIRSMVSQVKAAGYTGKISYNTAAQTALITAWQSEGIGSLDLIGWNSYDTLVNFTSHASTIVNDFGDKGYISEFGSITNGFSDYNDETAYYTDVAARIAAMKAANIPSGYFFCYRDGAFGVPANSFGLLQTNGQVHVAREAILLTPGQNYASFAAHN